MVASSPICPAPSTNASRGFHTCSRCWARYACSIALAHTLAGSASTPRCLSPCGTLTMYSASSTNDSVRYPWQRLMPRS